MESMDSLPHCPPYHFSSSLSSRAGYYPNISVEQLQAVTKLKESLISLELLPFDDCERDSPMELLTLLRFLRARNFDAKKSLEMIKEHIEWKKLKKIQDYLL